MKILPDMAGNTISGTKNIHAMNISFTPVGIIHSEHHNAIETPAQPVFAQDCYGTVEVFPAFAEGLKDIEGFSHLYLIYHLHNAGKPELTVKPFPEYC